MNKISDKLFASNLEDTEILFTRIEETEQVRSEATVGTQSTDGTHNV